MRKYLILALLLTGCSDNTSAPEANIESSAIEPIPTVITDKLIGDDCYWLEFKTGFPSITEPNSQACQYIEAQFQLINWDCEGDTLWPQIGTQVTYSDDDTLYIPKHFPGYLEVDDYYLIGDVADDFKITQFSDDQRGFIHVFMALKQGHTRPLYRRSHPNWLNITFKCITPGLTWIWHFNERDTLLVADSLECWGDGPIRDEAPVDPFASYLIPVDNDEDCCKTGGWGVCPHVYLPSSPAGAVPTVVTVDLRMIEARTVGNFIFTLCHTTDLVWTGHAALAAELAGSHYWRLWGEPSECAITFRAYGRSGTPTDNNGTLMTIDFKVKDDIAWERGGHWMWVESAGCRDTTWVPKPRRQSGEIPIQ
jgi:hypothetical protein